MYPRRLYTDGGGWMTQPGGISLPLAALNNPSARANLGIKLTFTRNPGTTWDYYLEYVTPTDWNQGLGRPSVFIRRMAPYGNGQTPAHLGTIEVPATTGVTNEFVEPSGNTRFTVARFDDQARILRVGAVRL